MRVPAGVVDVAVAVVIGEAVDPVERRVHVGPQRAGQRQVARPRDVLRDQDQEEQRRIHGAVVRRRLGDRPEPRQLARTQLVQDLARLRVAIGVDGLRLVAREQPQRLTRRGRAEGQRLDGDGGRVAAEQRREPRHARAEELAPVQARAQQAQVEERAQHDAVEERIRRAHLGRARQPELVEPLEPAPHARGPCAGTTGLAVLLALDAGRDVDTDLAPLTRRQRADELGAPAGETIGGRREREHRRAARTVARVVGELDGVAPQARPAHAAARPAHEALDDEDVLEARAEVERHRQPGGAGAIVADGQELVDDVAADEALAPDGDGVGRQHAAPALRQLRVREVVTRLEAARVGRRQQRRRLAVELEHEAVEHTRVAVEEAVAVRPLPRDVAGVVGEHEEAAVLEHDRVHRVADPRRVGLGEDPVFAGALRGAEGHDLTRRAGPHPAARAR